MDPVISSLWRAIGEAIVLFVRAAPGYEARLTPTAAMALSGELVSNYVAIAGGPDPEVRLREFVQVAQSRNLPLLAFVAEEINAALASTATDLGLQHAGSLPLMIFRPQAGSVASSPFQVVRVESEQDLHHTVDLACSASGFPLDATRRVLTPITLDVPGVEGFIARREGVPISTVWTIRGGATVGIWAMSTPPEYQRQGAGRALLEQVIANHVERGATLFYLMATEAGFPLYQRVGFQTVANPAVWVAGHSTQVGH